MGLNEIGEKSRATVILGNFVDIHNQAPMDYSLQKMLLIGQKIKAR